VFITWYSGFGGPTVVSETSSTNLTCTPCKTPKPKHQYSSQGESLKSRFAYNLLPYITFSFTRNLYKASIQNFLPSFMHWTNGSPVKRDGQLQMGLWLTTWHRASIPQVPGQGSWHFCEMQAWFWGHSELTTHSGLHDGGLPKKFGWQEHTAWPLVMRHTLFGPHGDGSHGFCDGRAVKNVIRLFVGILKIFF
jgi:hypothetical protein